jgi:predicted Fe-Mo cluster-binding NifX family protein
MRVAMPVRGGRISPVFDTARQLLLVDANQGKEQHRRLATLPRNSFLSKRPRVLRALKVDVLICGGISRTLAASLSRDRIALISWVAGSIESVLKAYLSRRLIDARWGMPGCHVQHIQPRTPPVEGRARSAKTATTTVRRSKNVHNARTEENVAQRRRP